MRRTIRERTASRWPVIAAAATAGALAVAGCGQQQLGAAALYGHQRISSTKLAAEVANLKTWYQRYQGRVQIGYPQSDMPRQVLNWMLRFAVTERLAAREHISVTPAQAQVQLSNERIRLQQAGDTLPEASVLNGLPPDLLPELGRWIAIQVQLASRLNNGVPPKTTAAQDAVNLRISQLQCLAVKSLNIKVNPQYGSYDFGQYLVVPAPNTLAKGSHASASPTPRPSPTCR